VDYPPFFFATIQADREYEVSRKTAEKLCFSAELKPGVAGTGFAEEAPKDFFSSLKKGA